jgi:hypothetical protein
MSSTKQKHVHYDRGTKGGKTHGHRSSRDSGVGSSSASDRASLGTAPNESSFTQQQIEDQRHILSAVQEALDAANERIKSLEAQSAQLNALLAESNKENRLLKREKTDLHNKVEDLLDLLDDERTANERLRRDSSPRSSTSDKPTRRIEAPPRPQANAGERRNSYYERPPIVPQAPPNPNPNPFTPLASRPPVVTYATAPAQVAYAPSTVSYAPAPVFAVSHPNHRKQTQPPNDGRYHLTPL